MDSQKIISQAWQITKNNKYLWVFGFLAGLGFSTGNFSTSFVQGGIWLFQEFGNYFQGFNPTNTLIIIISILFWLIGALARIGLIYEVAGLNAHDREPMKTFGATIHKALHYFARIIGMQMLIWTPVIILNLMPLFLSPPDIHTYQEGNRAVTTINAGIYRVIIDCINIFIYPILIIDAFAYRGIVLENWDVLSALKKTLAFLNTRLWATLGLLFTCFFIGGIIFVLVENILLLFLKPTVTTLSQCGDLDSGLAIQQCIDNSSRLVFLPSLISGLIIALLTSVWVVFQSATFTIAYQTLRESQ